MIHFGVGKLAHYHARQQSLDENIVAQNHIVAVRRTKRAKSGAGALGEFAPSHGHDDSFHIGESLDAIAMLIRPIETERGAPVMENEDHVVAQFEFFPKGKEKVPLLCACVTLGT